MLDPAYVREHPDEIRTGFRNRGLDPEAILSHLPSWMRSGAR